MNNNITDHFKASLPVVALSSPAPEEQNAIEELVTNIAIPLEMQVFCWDRANGMNMVQYHPEAGIVMETCSEYKETIDPILGVLDFIGSYNDHKRSLFIVLDIHYWLGSDPNLTDWVAIRQLKNLCFSLKQSRKRVVLLGQNIKLSDEFMGLIHEVSNDLPDREAISIAIEQCFGDLQVNNYQVEFDLTSLLGDRLIRVCQGLTLEEIRDALRLSAVRNQKVTASCIDEINGKKMAKLRRLNVEFCNPPTVPIGGLENLKAWIAKRSALFNNMGQLKTSLPNPKGLLLVGIPGTGKTLIAQTIGQLWAVPILKVDIGSLYSSLVGETEAQTRSLLKIAEAIAPCVMMLDEVEKAFAGAIGSGSDAGTSQRMFGTILTWLNDKTAPVFVVATANNISALPPEFLRKGRFDEIFFVDLPNEVEREEIFSLHLARHRCQLKSTELSQLAASAVDFNGAEIAMVVDEAAIGAFEENRHRAIENILYPDIKFEDVTLSIEATVPQARWDRDRIDALRSWADNSARKASAPQTKTESRRGSRQVNMLS